MSDALHEWQCPSCGATTRAQMAGPVPSNLIRRGIASIMAKAKVVKPSSRPNGPR